jgi:hypothetical protein
MKFEDIRGWATKEDVRIDIKNNKKYIYQVRLELLGRPKILGDCMIKLAFAVLRIFRAIAFHIAIVMGGLWGGTTGPIGIWVSLQHIAAISGRALITAILVPLHGSMLVTTKLIAALRMAIWVSIGG